MGAKHVRSWPRVVTFVLVMIAVGTLWGFGVGGVASLALAPNHAHAWMEGLGIRSDGEPIITSTSYWPEHETGPSRTLAGETLPADQPTLGGVRFFGSGERVFWNGPLTWSRDRLVQLSQDEGTNNWFLVRDASDEGRAYLAGYDRASKFSVGCIGRRGLVRGVPVEADQLVVGSLENRTAEILRSAGEKAPDDHFVFLFDEDRLVEVNLRTHAVRTVGQTREAYSMAAMTVPRADAADDEGDDEEGEDDDAATDDERSRDPRRVAAWAGDALVVFDPASGDHVDFELPAEVRANGSFDAYAVSPEQMVVAYMPPRSPSQSRLFWLRPDGPPTRDETIDWAGNGQVHGSPQQAAVVSAVIPIPILLGAMELAIAPPGFVAMGEVANYREALWKSLALFWPGTIVVLLASAAMAWIVYRAERKGGGRRAGWWAALVFLMGLPAFAAYLAERRPAPLGGKERAGPRMMGTEVFA